MQNRKQEEIKQKQYLYKTLSAKKKKTVQSKLNFLLVAKPQRRKPQAHSEIKSRN